MSRPKTDNEMRDAFANVVLEALREEVSWNGDTFEMSQTTSDCPMILATFGGERFNITITRARS
jgi:hypothetical protein